MHVLNRITEKKLQHRKVEFSKFCLAQAHESGGFLQSQPKTSIKTQQLSAALLSGGLNQVFY
jgi:hypothetical protein